MLRFREGMYMVAKTHVAAGARAVLPSIHGMPYKLVPNEIDQLKDAPLDPRAYVVDPLAFVRRLHDGQRPCALGVRRARPRARVRGAVRRGRVGDPDEVRASIHSTRSWRWLPYTRPPEMLA